MHLRVIGDGVSTVAELVDQVNQDPRRGDDGSSAPLYGTLESWCKPDAAADAPGCGTPGPQWSGDCKCYDGRSIPYR